MNDEKNAHPNDGSKKNDDDDAATPTHDSGIKLVFPEKIDLNAAEYELQLMIDAFCDLAEQLLNEEKEAKEAQAPHKKPADNPQQ